MKFMVDSKQAVRLWWLAASRASVTWPNKQLSTLWQGFMEAYCWFMRFSPEGTQIDCR